VGVFSGMMEETFKPFTIVGKNIEWNVLYNDRFNCTIVRTNEVRGFLFIFDEVRAHKEIWAQEIHLAPGVNYWQAIVRNFFETYFDHPANDLTLRLN
jgi:hypothetical protein